MVLERNVRVSDAKDEIMGVLAEIEREKLLDHYLLDTIQRTVARMIHAEEYLARYMEIIEVLVQEHPKDKELVAAVFEGSLKNNKFAQAAKMAAKLLNNFEERDYALT